MNELMTAKHFEDCLWVKAAEAADEIESLRQRLVSVTKTLDETAPWRELQAENKELRKQLAECERERDQFKGAVDSYMKAYDDCREEHTNTHAKLVALEEETAPKWRRYERVCEQLATMTAERDELVVVMKRIHDHAMQAPYANSAIIGLAQHALAKLGADKNGDGS